MSIVRIDGVIGWDVTAKSFRKDLKSQSGDFTLEINSPGGSVFDGIDIFNAIKDYKGGTIDIVVTGLAASMASYIMMAGESLSFRENSCVMIHNPYTFAVGDYSEMGKVSKFLKQLSSVMVKGYSKFTGKNEEEIQSDMDETTYYVLDDLKMWGEVNELSDNKNKDTNTKSLDADSIRGEYEIKVNAMLSKISSQKENEDKINSYSGLLSLSSEESGNVKSDPVKKVKSLDLESEENKKEGVKKAMTKEELKAKYPELVAEIQKDAVAKELDRVNAHLAFIETSPKAAKKAIQSGEDLSMTAQAEYMKGLACKSEAEKLINSSEEDLDVKGKEEKLNKSKEEKEAADAEAKEEEEVKAIYETSSVGYKE